MYKKISIGVLLCVVLISMEAQVVRSVYAQDSVIDSTQSATLEDSIDPIPSQTEENSDAFSIATASGSPVIPLESVTISDFERDATESGAIVATEGVFASPTPQPKLDVRPTFSSGFFRRPVRIRRILKRQYQANEPVSVVVENAQLSSYEAVVVDREDNIVASHVEEEVIEGEIVLNVYPARSVEPGRYKIRVTDEHGTITEQDFTWGVLAINTNKSMYLPNEKSTIAIAVLNELGSMVCDADVTLGITDPSGSRIQMSTRDGSIKVNPECQVRAVTHKPDYETSYTVGGVGNYSMDLTANTSNGTYSITDTFMVVESAPFEVERISATRIFPYAPYTVEFHIKVNQDFTGRVVETVPHIFEIASGSAGVSYDELEAHAPISDPEATVVSLRQPYNDAHTETLGFGEQPIDPLVAAQYRYFGLRAHDGIDYDLPEGTPVVSADAGEVLLAGEGAYGTTIVLQHQWGKSYYGHLSSISVQVGDVVEAGKQLGLSGSTGLSTGPHLHFGIKLNKHDMRNGYFGKIDPSPYINNKFIVSDQLTKQLSWHVDWKAGDTAVLSYQFDSPDQSPDFYLLGPLTFYGSGMTTPGAMPTPEGNPFVLGIESQASTSSALPVTFGPLPVASESGQVEGAQAEEIVFAEARQWQLAIDAHVTIDSSVFATDVSHNNIGVVTVFTTDQIGYVFYMDSDGDCKYSKTTDGGANWGAAVMVRDATANDCYRNAVWYDQWTPGDRFGTIIHIVTSDPTSDDLFYQTLDTNGDTLSSAINLTDASATNKTNTFSNGTSQRPYITKGTNGAIWIGVNDDDSTAASYIIKCISACTTATNWSDESPSGLEADNDNDDILMPQPNGDILLIFWDDSANDFLSKYYTWSTDSWSGSFTVVDNDAVATPGNNFEGNFGALVDKQSYKVYHIYLGDNATVGGDDDVRIAVYSGGASGSWTAGANVLTNDARGLQQARIAIDESLGDLYAVYTATVTAAVVSSGQVLYKVSTDGAVSWGAEQGPINTVNNFLIGLDVTPWGNERIYSTWTAGAATDDLQGGTVADINNRIPLHLLMRHGNWFGRGGNVGTEQYFTF